MRKHRFRVAIPAVLMGILLFYSLVSASVEKLNISQIVQKGNDVYLYVSALDSAGRPSGDAVSPEQLSVVIDKGEPIPVSEAPVFNSTGAGVSYVFCIDVSKSLTEQEMQDIRAGLTEFVNGMGAGDYARIITIGTDVNSPCNSTTDKNALNSAIAGITRNADYTYLYKGISFALDGLRKNVDTMPERSAIVLFTDGMDDSDGSSGEEQVLVDIAETRVPIYVVGVKGNDSAANLNSVGQIARQSGGSVFSYSEMTVSAALQNVKAIMDQTYCLHVVPADETFGQQNLVWSVMYNSDGYSVTSTNYVYSLGMDQVVIEEPVTPEPPSPTPEPTASPTPEPTPTPVPEKSAFEKIGDFVKENWILCVVALVILIVVIVVIVMTVRKKKREEEELDRLVRTPVPDRDREQDVTRPLDETVDTSTDPYDEDETISDDDDESTIDGIPETGIRLSFEITFDGRTETVEKVLHDELVLGRGSECDVDVVLGSGAEERKLTSRKHAVIFDRPDGLYVRDNSRNRTFLNGVEVRDEVSLRDEDVLLLGKASVKVRILGMKRGR